MMRVKVEVNCKERIGKISPSFNFKNDYQWQWMKSEIEEREYEISLKKTKFII